MTRDPYPTWHRALYADQLPPAPAGPLTRLRRALAALRHHRKGTRR